MEDELPETPQLPDAGNSANEATALPHPDALTPKRGLEWFNITCRWQTGALAALHQIPREDFLHEADPEGQCACGPWKVDGSVPFFRHWPLDFELAGEWNG